MKPGYWDQNIRNPGSIPAARRWHTLPRGVDFGLVDRDSGLRHVNIESWNEYDEGSGIYAANPGPP